VALNDPRVNDMEYLIGSNGQIHPSRHMELCGTADKAFISLNTRTQEPFIFQWTAAGQPCPHAS